MATDRVFGIGSSTCAPITGIVVGDATITGDIGTIKKLTGNPFTTIVETRMSTPYIRKMTITGAYEVVTGIDQALLGTEVTLTVGSDTTNLAMSGGAGPSDTITLTGMCTEFSIKLNKDDWAVASISVEKKGPTVA
jgi:hypothetical protein